MGVICLLIRGVRPIGQRDLLLFQELADRAGSALEGSVEGGNPVTMKALGAAFRAGWSTPVLAEVEGLDSAGPRAGFRSGDAPVA